MQLKYIIGFVLVFSFIGNSNAQNKINWITWEEAQIATQSDPRPILVDVYTSWCGYCKLLDKTTFKNKSIVSFINENMYAIKFDAEVDRTIVFDGVSYQNLERNNKQGSHELANAILNNQMSYPSIVYFNENLERITISQGYKKAKELQHILNFITEKAYLKVSLEDY